MWELAAQFLSWLQASCCCSATQSCLTLFDTMDRSTPGFPVLHYLLELAQTHVHWVDGAIQPSHPLSPPSPPAFNPSQHQGLFQSVGSLHQGAKVLEFHLQYQSFQWVFKVDVLWVDWFDLLAVQRTLKSLLQHHSSKASFPQHLWRWSNPTTSLCLGFSSTSHKDQTSYSMHVRTQKFLAHSKYNVRYLPVLLKTLKDRTKLFSSSNASPCSSNCILRFLNKKKKIAKR